MTIFKSQIRQDIIAFVVWTLSIISLIVLCIFLYPSMTSQMDMVGEMFSSMGSFSAAFGMDKLNFGSMIGFYSVECGNILGLGGCFYSCLYSINMLSKEEKEKTAEFLLTHPVKRSSVYLQKLLAIFVEITLMNLLVYACSLISIKMIGESISMKSFNLIHLAYYLMQLELMGLCLGISATNNKNNGGVGLGIGLLMYILNVVANVSDKLKAVKHISPFGYCEASEIIAEGCLDGVKLLIALAIAVISLVGGYLVYRQKDIK
ncbi:MAG: ABC transporter permease subunit [Erysipelotrichaceae bacterium]